MTDTLPIDDLRVDELAATLSDEERLRIAKDMVVAAFKLCPTNPDDRLALTNTLLGAVNALLRSPAERQRAAFWDALAERQNAIGRVN